MVKCKKVLLIVGDKFGKYIAAIAVIILVTVIINTIIFARLHTDPLEGKSVIIDPGHGGIDGGTNDGSTFFEKDINLQIALKLCKILEEHKMYVSLTRESDVSLVGQDTSSPPSYGRHLKDLTARVEQFNSGKADIFISIHVNYSNNRSAMGPMVYYSPKSPQDTFLAQCLQSSLNEHIKANLNRSVSHDAVKSNAYFILKNSNIPGVIVETGFISNIIEKVLLKDEGYQLKVANSICTGMKDYFRNVQNQSNLKQEDVPPANNPDEDENSIPIDIVNEARLVSR